MRINLKEIESKLQRFFEEQLWFPNETDPFRRLTNEIIREIMENSSVKDGITYTGNIVRITMNERLKGNFSEDDFSLWKQFLKTAITETVHENNMRLSGPLHIQLFFDPKVAEDYIISVASSSKPSKKTVNIILDESKPSDEDIVPGYLITPDKNVFSLNKKIINIGRREDNELVIDNLRISRVHAQIRQINSRHVIFDLDSTLGTKVNGERITQKILSHGDVIEIADVLLIYDNEPGEFTDSKSGNTKIFPAGREFE